MTSIQLLDGQLHKHAFLSSARSVSQSVTYPEWRRRAPEDRVQPLFKLNQLLEVFSGNDSVLVPSLRSSDREHIHP